MVSCSDVAAKDRKQVPSAERLAVSFEIRQLLNERDEYGRRKWSQARLGEALGGLSQETIRRAVTQAGVTPAVRDGLLALQKTTMPDLLKKHLLEADAAGRLISARVQVEVVSPRYTSRERAIRALILLGRPEDKVREAADAVAVALDSETDLDPEWWAERIKLEMAALKRGSEPLGVREIADDVEVEPGTS